jgi:hypothetical protein
MLFFPNSTGFPTCKNNLQTPFHFTWATIPFAARHERKVLVVPVPVETLQVVDYLLQPLG